MGALGLRPYYHWTVCEGERAIFDYDKETIVLQMREGTYGHAYLLT